MENSKFDMTSMRERVFSAFCEDSSVHNGKNVDLLSAQTLAYIGDTVYDLYVRSYLISLTDLRPHELHSASAKRVCAHSQAQAYFAVKDRLTEDEIAVCKRGRNAHTNSVPKSATIADYRTATGLEALLGYLYLNGQDERLSEVMSLVLNELKNL